MNTPHRRFNPLTREWILVSPQRSTRPWLGQVEKTSTTQMPDYDPACYLCPGNKRAEGAVNPPYPGVYVFDNDFPALLENESQQDPSASHSLFQSESESGICRVVCFSPHHNLSLPELSQAEVESVVEAWARENKNLSSKPNIAYVQIFENKGAAMGCSNPHPHSQIWAQSRVSNEPDREWLSQKDYFSEHGRPLLLDYVQEELHRNERIIASNDHFSVLVPYWAIWPFETLLIAHRPCRNLNELTSAETSSLAQMLQAITTRYDNLFEISFPYSMGFHQAPNDPSSHPEWVLHAHFYPPLLRSASVRKFMVGYEMLGMPQRDITPETAAVRLRELSEIHYTKQNG
ncbi:MAG: UDP-glucose--hexose-1-phosphate uridylyltransferase [Chloroflexi bacterium]|nr:UDP-glucose--hexose-1-phosphate uridylyltransferase [Chloroflexota bacterium]